MRARRAAYVKERGGGGWGGGRLRAGLQARALARQDDGVVHGVWAGESADPYIGQQLRDGYWVKAKFAGVRPARAGHH